MELHHPCHRPETDTKASGIEIHVGRVALPIRMIRTSLRNASKSGFGPGFESDTGDTFPVHVEDEGRRGIVAALGEARLQRRIVQFRH